MRLLIATLQPTAGIADKESNCKTAITPIWGNLTGKGSFPRLTPPAAHEG
jgi:hypothetical protein